MVEDSPVQESGFYTMSEAIKLIGVSRYTLIKWFAQGKVAEVPRNRRNNYRMFRPEDIERIRAYAQALDVPTKGDDRQGMLFET